MSQLFLVTFFQALNYLVCNCTCKILSVGLKFLPTSSGTDPSSLISMSLGRSHRISTKHAGVCLFSQQICLRWGWGWKEPNPEQRHVAFSSIRKNLRHKGGPHFWKEIDNDAMVQGAQKGVWGDRTASSCPRIKGKSRT